MNGENLSRKIYILFLFFIYLFLVGRIIVVWEKSDKFLGYEINIYRNRSVDWDSFLWKKFGFKD